MKKKAPVAINTFTDTGVLFEVGNSLIGFSVSIEAGIISLAVAILCISARMTGELKKIGRFPAIRSDHSPIARKTLSLLSYIADNLGASLMISGVALLIAAIFAAYHTDADAAQAFIITYKETLILTCFGIANFVRGSARGMKHNSLNQRLFDVTGISLAAAGVILAGKDFTLDSLYPLTAEAMGIIFLLLLFTGAAIMAAYQAIKSLPAKGWLQPDLCFAAGCIGNAFLCETMTLVIANSLFALAYISLDSLKKRGGLYEGVHYLMNPAKG